MHHCAKRYNRIRGSKVKDCDFVGCMHNLDQSHCIFSSIYLYGIMVISVIYCAFLIILFIIL